jgi:hypothetical protein
MELPCVKNAIKKQKIMLNIENYAKKHLKIWKKLYETHTKKII